MSEAMIRLLATVLLTRLIARTIPFLSDLFQRHVGERPATINPILLLMSNYAGLDAQHPVKLKYLDITSACFEQCFQRSGEATDLEIAIACARAALMHTPPLETSQVATRLHHLGYLLKFRFLKTDDPKDLDEAIIQAKRALDLWPHGHEERYMPLNTLAECLTIRFDRFEDANALKEGIQRSREAVSLWPPGAPETEKALNILAHSLLSRFKRFGERIDLDESIVHRQECLSQQSLGPYDLLSHLTGLGNALLVRFQQTGNAADLEVMIDSYKEALSLLSPHHPHRSIGVLNLAGAVMLRFDHEGKMTDLEEAINLYQDLLRLRPPGHPKRHSPLSNIGIALLKRFNKLGSIADLHSAIGYLKESTTAGAPDHPDLPTCFINLANALSIRFDQGGDPSDLDQTIFYIHQALVLQPPDHPGQRGTLITLAGFLRLRFDRQGDIGDLEEAIRHQRDTLKQIPSGHVHRSSQLINLASSLHARFHIHHELRDVQEGIYCYEEALLLDTPGNPGRSLTLNNLGNSLITRHIQTQNVEDLEVAIQKIREALVLRPHGNTGRPLSLLSLGHGLYMRYQNSGDSTNLDQAIDHFREALLLQSPGHISGPDTLGYLGKSLLHRYRANQKSTDLEEALLCHKESLRGMPSDHPRAATEMSRLAKAYLAYSTLPGEQARLEEARDLLRKAVDHPTAGVHTRLEISLELVANLEGIQRVQAYQKCLELTDRYVSIRPSIPSRHKLVSSVPRHLISEAAAYAIQAGQIETAVELLEQGRTILWSQMGRYRTPLDALREADDGLATEFERLSFRIENTAVSSDAVDGSQRSLEDEASQYRRLSNEWNHLVDKIRTLSGLENFLEITPFAILRQAASSGPIVILNIDILRSDAIILTKGGDAVLVPLPNAKPGHIDQLVVDFRISLRLKSGQPRKAKMLVFLRTLWKDVVKPVVDHLQSSGMTQGSRIWWCPTSKLSHLPLHATGPYQKSMVDLPELFVSSYTPTVTALLKSNQSHAASTSQLPSILIVAQPDTPGQPPIPYVQKEVESIQAIAPNADLLFKNDGNYKAVIAGLQSHRWIHFACHGSQNLEEPFKSHFHLYDKPLTLLDIIRARLPDAEFAFLAACLSAAGDRNTPDEIIHLAAALQFSGFRSVIGTLYSMADEDGPVVANEVYKYMFRRVGLGTTDEPMVDFRDSAVALNRATRTLKERKVPVDRWINFVHIGA